MKISLFFHPVTIFVSSLLALGVSLYLYIDSYLRVNEALKTFIEKSGVPKTQFKSPETWVMILTLSILVVLIITGMIIIFTYYQKVIQLYRMQQSFINGFTHELKTPIASLKIFIDTFKIHEIEREKQLEYLDLMSRDTDRLQSNVMQILNMAKIEDRNFKPSLKSINIYDFTEDFLKKNDYIFKEIEIVNEVESRFISFDKDLLEIVFMNLMTNALRYNNSERKKLIISSKRSGNYIELSFIDNGIGINKDHHKSIFKKFFQVGKSVKGSGIGLYMVHQILKVHSGAAKVSSEGEGLGSTFILKIKEEK